MMLMAVAFVLSAGHVMAEMPDQTNDVPVVGEADFAEIYASWDHA